MVEVEFLGPINKDSLKLDIDNLNQLADILQNDNEVKDWLKSCAVALNDTLVTNLDVELKDGDKISLLPPVCGG
jgi:molybdopterin synthase sulfur carrier subunit